MEFIKNGLYPILLLLFLSSCKDQVSNVNKDYGKLDKQYGLKSVGTKKLLLDSLSDNFFFSYQMVDVDGKEHFTFLNPRTNTIYFYDWENTSISKKIPLVDEGPDGVGIAAGYQIQGTDSIFVYSEERRTISLVNGDNRLVKKIWIPFYDKAPPPGEKMIYSPDINVSGINPAVFHDNAFYLAGLINAELDDFDENNTFTYTDIILDDLNHKVEYSVPYPRLYSEGNWLGSSFRRISSTYNDLEEKIIVSFPASHQLYVRDLRDNTLEERFGASNLANEILSMDKDYHHTTSQERIIFFMGADSYGPILWDRYRNCYYRMFFKGNKNNEDMRNPGDFYRNISIVILDKDFNYLGEEEFEGDTYSNTTIFVSPEGLVLYNYGDYKSDENYLSFEVFALDEVNPDEKTLEENPE